MRKMEEKQNTRRKNDEGKCYGKNVRDAKMPEVYSKFRGGEWE